jgi:hypothetical protein
MQTLALETQFLANKVFPGRTDNEVTAEELPKLVDQLMTLRL